MKAWPNVAPFFRRHRWLSMVLFALCIIAITLTFFTGCLSLKTQQFTDKVPLYQYKPDILITVDGQTFDGMAVTLLNGPKDIQITSKAKLDLLMISSCHRNFTVERVGYKGNWFGVGGASAKTFTYHYAPTTIEKEGFCPLYIQAFDKSGITAWGYMAFRTEEALPAKTECNGTGWKFSGVSVCSSRAEFEQAVSFDRPVKFEVSDLCKITEKPGNSFRLRTQKGFCYATFTDGTDLHRVVLLGYDEALIRGE